MELELEMGSGMEKVSV